MIMKLATAGAVCLGALILSACVSQQQYDAAAAENQQLKAQLAALQAELARLAGIQPGRSSLRMPSS